MKRVFLKFVIFCLITTAFSADAVNAQSKKALKKAAEKANKLAVEAKKSFDQNDYKTAVSKYADAIVLTPNNPEFHYLKGKAHYELKEFDKAINEFDTALSQNYASPLEIYKLRWSLNFNNKNLDAALDDAQKASKLAPEDASFNLALGQIYLAKNSYSAAIPAFQNVVRLDPNNADAYYYLAAAYQSSGDYKNQQINAAQAVKGNTKFLNESYFLLGDGAQKSKDYPSAIEAYRKSLSANPNNRLIYHNLSDIYRIQNQFAAATEIAKKGIEFFPADANLYLDLSRYYSLGDQSALAIGAAQQAVRLMPEKSVSYASLCRAYYEDKQFQAALEACKSALKLNSDDGEANVYLGFTNLSLDKSDTANEFFAKAVSGLKDYTMKNPEYSDGFYLLGNAYYYAKQPENAIEAYSKSLQLNPLFTKARFNLGLAYFVNGNVTAAQAQYDALMKQDKELAAKLKQVIDKKK